MRSTLRTLLLREAPALLLAYLFVGAAVAYTLAAEPSASYRDEWGFAEFAWARALVSGTTPLPVDAPGGSPFLKVRDVCCSVGSEAAAAGLAVALHVPLETVYAQGWWGVLLAPLLAYVLVRRVAGPWASACAAAGSVALTVGFPYYLVDPRGLMLTTHALFLLLAWRAAQKPTVGRTLAAVAGAVATGFVYMPLGLVELLMLVLLLLFVRAPRPALRASLLAPALVVAVAPDCVRPYVAAILAHPHHFQYPPPAIPYALPHHVSVQMVAALVFGAILGVTLLARWRAGLPHRFLLAATCAAVLFGVLPFSLHRFFTFVVLPLGLALAHATARPEPSAHAARVGAPRALAAGSLVLGVLPRLPRVPPRAVSAGAGVGLALLLVLAGASCASFPSAPVAKYGTFSPAYLEGVRWVAANVEGNFTSDLKFAGAHFAYTGRANGQQVLDDYDTTGNLTRMWYSPDVDATLDVMRGQGSCTLVLTSDMPRIIIVADFYREGVAAKIEQVRRSDSFRLVFRNADVEVYHVASCEGNTWPAPSPSPSPHAGSKFDGRPDA